MEESREKIWKLVFVLTLGQLVSFCCAIIFFTSSLIADLGADTPLTQSFFGYLLIFITYGSVFLSRRRKLLVPWYWYFALALVDVQGNYLVVKAFQYSSVTSLTLLYCWTIPWVMILTWSALGTKYVIWQYLGAAICILGLALVLLSDSGVSGGGGTNPLLGDTLLIAGTVCFALSNVAEEFCVKKKDLVEVLTMLGMFGVLISACQICVFERKSLESLKWSPTLVSLFVGFAVAEILFYSLAPLVMQKSGATLLNLSLLTSDMWAVAIRVYFYNQQVDWLYYIAFGMVAIGLAIYSVNEDRASSETNSNCVVGSYEPIADESPASEVALGV